MCCKNPSWIPTVLNCITVHCKNKRFNIWNDLEQKLFDVEIKLNNALLLITIGIVFISILRLIKNRYLHVCIINIYNLILCKECIIQKIINTSLFLRRKLCFEVETNYNNVVEKNNSVHNKNTKFLIVIKFQLSMINCSKKYSSIVLVYNNTNNTFSWSYQIIFMQ